MNHNIPNPYIYYGLYDYTSGMLVFVANTLLKKHFKRGRPEYNPKVYRIRNIRGKEIDCSFPSGDTA